MSSSQYTLILIQFRSTKSESHGKTSSDYRSLGGIGKMFEIEDDIINQWISESGIELIHQTPTKQELDDIWNRW